MSKRKKILIAVGGTGGHTYPSQALAHQLYEKDDSIEMLFVGAGLSQNRFFDRKAFSFKEVSSGTLSPKKPLKSLLNVGRLVKGIAQSLKVLRAFQPDVVVGFGSFHSLPILLAARWKKVPLVLYAADTIPGRVIRYFAKKAQVTGIFFSETAQHLKGATETVAMPLRPGYSVGVLSKHEAREYFDLDPSKFTFLVFGGSQGALSINTLFCDAMKNLSSKIDHFQVLHFTGAKSSLDEIREKYRKMGIQACVRDFESSMNIAWAAADIVISRSGAMSIAEQLAMEIPGILIPYPHAMDNHQEKNADFMVQAIGAAVKLNQEGLTEEKLSTAIFGLIDNQQEVLKAMRQSMQNYKKQSPRRDLSALVYERGAREL